MPDWLTIFVLIDYIAGLATGVGGTLLIHEWYRARYGAPSGPKPPIQTRAERKAALEVRRRREAQSRALASVPAGARTSSIDWLNYQYIKVFKERSLAARRAQEAARAGRQPVGSTHGRGA